MIEQPPAFDIHNIKDIINLLNDCRFPPIIERINNECLYWDKVKHLGGGQILVCVGGRGYYQEWGKEPVELFPGDAVYISAGVKHWHGAAPDSWFSHLAIEAPGENKSNEWLEPVSEEEYSGVVRHQC